MAVGALVAVLHGLVIIPAVLEDDVVGVGLDLGVLMTDGDAVGVEVAVAEGVVGLVGTVLAAPRPELHHVGDEAVLDARHRYPRVVDLGVVGAVRARYLVRVAGGDVARLGEDEVGGIVVVAE